MNQSAAVVVFLLLVSITSFGYQTTRVPEYFTSNYTDESGLPQNSIRKIVADSIGFIWLATEGGLVRYDGRTFKVFNRATLGIESERIPTFKRNPSNQNLYAIAEGTQLIKIRGGRAFKETTYNTVRSLDRSFLLPIQKQSGDHFEIPDVIAQNKINYQVILGKAPQYYLYKDQKVFFCQQGRLQTSVKFPGRMSFDIPPLQWSQEMGRIMLGESNNVYNFIDIDGHLFYHIGGHGQNFLHVQPNPSSTDNRLPLSGDITQNLDFRSSPDQVTVINNPFNSQTFAYLGRHFYIINYIDGKLNTRLIMKDVDFEKNNIVSAYYNANNGIVFLGSTTKGLFIHTPKYFNILSYDAKWDNNVFYSHLPYGNSSVITPQGYIGDLLNPTKKTTPVTRDKERSSKLTMLRDRDKNLWMVKLGPQNFIQKFGPDAGNVIGSWLINDGPTKLYQGNGAGIWIGTLSGQLYYLPQAGNTSSSIEKVARIANAEITWLYQDNNTSILVGTTNGLFRFLPNSKKVIPVAGFENLNIRSVFASDPGRLWVTTYGSGIFLMEGSKVHKLPLDQGR